MENKERTSNYKCPICYDFYLYPVSLPCSHRFCKSCFDQHVENNTLSCPICRQRVAIWLRKLKRSNSDFVDRKFWEKIQRLFPDQIQTRLNEQIDQTSNIDLIKNIANYDTTEKKKCRRVHEAIISYITKADRNWTDEEDMPRRSFAEPGEIRQEYEQLQQKEEEYKKRKEEENYRLSAPIIKLLEEEERREKEERLRQLKEDEELARRLTQEENPEEKSQNSPSTPMTRSRTPRTPRVGIENTPTRKKSGIPKSLFGSPLATKDPKLSPTTESHSSKCTDTVSVPSPIPLDKPSTSKEDIFAKYWTSTDTLCSNSSQKCDTQEYSSTSLETSISNKELSHFAPVPPGPTTLTNGPTTGQLATVPSSRCSSGCDSIGQELRHFKPIRSSPTTPPKDGSRCLMPQMVVPQRGVIDTSDQPPVLTPVNIDTINLLGADITLEDLETSINLETQIEEDKKLALKLQKELDEEEKNRLKTEYNLRKRKRDAPTSSLKKKVLIDRTQTTLDKLLIK